MATEFCEHCPTDGSRCGVCSPDLLPKATVVLAKTSTGLWFLGDKVGTGREGVLQLKDVVAYYTGMSPVAGPKTATLVDIAIPVSGLIRMWTGRTREEVLEAAKSDGDGKNFYLFGE